MQTEDEQTFLLRQQEILKQGGQMRGDSPLRSQGGNKGMQPRTPGSGGQGSPIKVNAKPTPATPGNEGVLANFFNSLLHKKSGSPATPATPPNAPNASSTPRTNGTDGAIDKLAMRSDAAAELDRLTRSAKKEMDYSQSEC